MSPWRGLKRAKLSSLLLDQLPSRLAQNVEWFRNWISRHCHLVALNYELRVWGTSGITLKLIVAVTGCLDFMLIKF